MNASDGPDTSAAQLGKVIAVLRYEDMFTTMLLSPCADLNTTNASVLWIRTASVRAWDGATQNSTNETTPARSLRDQIMGCAGS